MISEDSQSRARLITVLVVTFLLAFAVTAQIKAQLIPSSNTVARNQVLLNTVTGLERDNQALRDRIAAIAAQTRALDKRLAQTSALAHDTAAQAQSQRELAGLTSASGPGVVVDLVDGTNPHRSDDTKNEWRVHYIDIQDVVNLLWSAGAEAIGINHERMVPTSSFYVAGADVLLNGVHLASPYHIEVIGDGSHFNQALSDNSSLADLKTRSDVYQLRFSWKTERSLQLSAYEGAFLVRFAVAGQ
jgi:uncharacterized protein YlxW (UPF0749 family)